MDKETQEKFFEGTNNLITSIAQQVNDTIPEEWENFYFHADINDDFSGGVYFFYNTDGSQKYIYSEDIPEIYNIDEDEYDEKNYQLYKLSKSLKQWFMEYEQAPWQAITIVVDSERKMKMDFDYADWLSSPYTPTPLMDYFEYRYLGKMPESKEQEELFKEMEEYQKSFNEKKE